MTDSSQSQTERLVSEEERCFEALCAEVESLYEEFTEALESLWKETKAAIEEYLQYQVSLVTHDVEAWRAAKQREAEVQTHYSTARSFLDQATALKQV